MAEGIFRLRLAQAGFGKGYELDSAGTGSWHVGEPPDRRAQEAAARLGADLSKIRARQFKRADVERFDLVLAMDRDNLRVIREHPGAAQRAHLTLPWLGMTGAQDVPDPYYGGANEFAAVADLLDSAAQRFIERLREQA